MTITSYSPLMLPSQRQVTCQALSAHRHLATAPHRHFEWSRPTFSSPFASCEWVGLRREKSLFDQASSANCYSTRRRLIAIPPFPVPQSAAVDRTFHVYLMASKSGVLYVGVTSNLAKRIAAPRR
jgi:hypothetical protein